MLRFCSVLVAACLAASAQTAAPQDDAGRDVSLNKLAPNLLQDQKKIWTYPGHAVSSREWIPAVAVLGTTAALLAADPYTAHYFENTKDWGNFNTTLSSNATEAAILAVPVVFYVAGWRTHDEKARRTGLLAGEALIDAEILNEVLKVAIRRERPIDVKNGNYWDTWTDGNISSSSFPSGHTIGAFAVATVIATRYRDHRWVPWVAYGSACLVGFSRLPLGQHYVSDVFFGGALGFSISKFAVLRY